MMIISAIVARKYNYPPFVPLHPELLRDGVSLIAAAVYGDYELAAKQRGVLSIAGSLAVERSIREVAHELNLSPTQVKRARKELVAKGLIRAVKQPWGRPSLTVVYTYTLDDDATPPAGAVPDLTQKTKADGTTASASGSGTKEALESSPAKEADHMLASPPEKQEVGTSVPPLAEAFEGAPAHCLEGVAEPSDGSSVSSHEGTVAASHSLICVIPPPYIERGKSSLHPYGRYGNVMLTDEEYQDVKDKLGEHAEAYIDHFSSKQNDKHYYCPNHYREILRWWESDKDDWTRRHHMGGQRRFPEPGEPGNSFDTNDFFDSALAKSFGDDYEFDGGK